MKNKYKDYTGYEGFKRIEHSRLKREYDEHMEKNYYEAMPDTYISFDDFCMGQWQRL